MQREGCHKSLVWSRAKSGILLTFSANGIYHLAEPVSGTGPHKFRRMGEEMGVETSP